ncbi:MAG TPA: WbqC family protein, partial [Methylomirabilota bacterium]|nr:WbqC family protein [Methylomirabilota bacterium]
MKVAIHQPQYLPWIGYFDKIDQADCFVALDTVQFKKNEWQNRNRIKTPGGWQWLTVPVRQRFLQRIADVEIDNTAAWPRKHLQALTQSYGGSPFFGVHAPFFRTLYSRRWDRLLDLNVAVLRYLVDALQIRTELILASSLTAPGTATQRLVEICRALGADTYISGAGGKDYLD